MRDYDVVRRFDVATGTMFDWLHCIGGHEPCQDESRTQGALDQSFVSRRRNYQAVEKVLTSMGNGRETNNESKNRAFPAMFDQPFQVLPCCDHHSFDICLVKPLKRKRLRR